MFQSFDATTRPEDGPPRLAALRAAMVEAGVDGVLVPRADAHQGEYVAECDARLAWLTGFTGSAGFAAVLAEIAGLFVDGRYRVQVRAQAADVFTPVDWPQTKLAPWLIEKAPPGAQIGYDPWLHTIDEIAKLSEALKAGGLSLRALDGNLVDGIWDDRPPPPQGPITAYPLEFAGTPSAEKRATAAAALSAAGESAAVLTLPDSIAWLLNIRGADLPRVPVPLAFAILLADGTVDLFTDPAKLAGVDLGPDIRAHPPGDFTAALGALTGKVRVDPASAPQAVAAGLGAEAQISRGDDPCRLPKARKTSVEIAGARAAHLRDAAAMVEFLAWLDAQNPGALTEIDVVKSLEGFRRASNALKDISFDTICGAGPNGAIVHYRVTEETNRRLASGELLLVDSGGQYLDGTTDITRTIALGPAGDEERDAYTRVLQGMIAVSRARWPRGLAGRDLDPLARFPLWTAGRDYDHGTGHGVGAYLSVHEGPQRLARTGEVPLEPGMILSNEPGYYREGAFGIRIENLVVVSEAPPLPGADDREMLAFETLTHVPLDRRLIAVARLSPDERAWLDTYHRRCAEMLAGRLSPAAAAWLERAVAPL